MTALSYYPGCSLHASARDYAESIDGVCAALGIELKEIPDWNCCGATAAHALNHELALGLAARNLHLAERIGLDVVIPCALCFHELKAGEKAILDDGWGGAAARFPFEGKIKLWDLLAYLSQDEWIERLKSRVVRPLTGLKVVCYYGCQSARPPQITDHADPEWPTEMDRIVAACGGEPIEWAYKTDCCGASHSIPRPDILHKLVGDLYDRAEEAGAEAMVVSCQMCQLNVDIYQTEIGAGRGRNYNLPALYFTELMGLAMGLKEADTWLGRHFVDPRPLVRRHL